MQFFAASPYGAPRDDCTCSCLNEKFLALGRGSLPADLVYELQFSFNFQLPVVKDQKMVLDTIGGGSRIRTGDILLAKQTLYQLSYTPKGFMVGLTRIELVTSSLSGTRSNQLSYKPNVSL